MSSDMTMHLAIRALSRTPWYAATAVGTICLTIALGATVFAVVDGVLFKPLPYPQPDHLFHLTGSSGNPNEGGASLSPADVKYLNEASPLISVTGIGGAASVTPPDRPDLPISAASIDTAFFSVLGQYPLVGDFTTEDYLAAPAPNAPRPAIISHAFWRQRLASDPAPVGRTIEMLGSRLRIAGVLPRDFLFPVSFGLGRPPEILVPLILPPAALSNRWNRSLTAIARLRDGIKRDEAQAKLNASLASRVGEYSQKDDTRPGPYVAVRMRLLNSYLRSSERPLFSVGFTSAALLILLGAINVAGLSSARASDRDRELSIRAALGAGRRHLLALLLAEALVVAVIGGALGVLLAGPLLTVALGVLPDSVQLLKTPAIDGRVMIFAILAAIVPVVSCALIPALAVLKSAPAHRLIVSQTCTPRVNGWGRSALLAAESAIGMILVVFGSLMLASFVVVRHADAGFDPNGLAVVEVGHIGSIAPDQRAAKDALVFDRMKAAPGVLNVAIVGGFVLQHMYAGSQFRLPIRGNRILRERCADI